MLHPADPTEHNAKARWLLKRDAWLAQRWPSGCGARIFCRDGVMTTMLFGYDTALPQELGLYRMLSAALLELARENGDLLHESSGAAQFKRNRGARADIGYSAVFCDHLP
ncbi:hypothetical protein ABU162_18735 [Paenibacillus thiaminolyticus]|uniref:hypothetical protein n=1 Tax=Paenibacillus thiaminolyticus TaxID=49283 RepID=UPI0035A6CE90